MQTQIGQRRLGCDTGGRAVRKVMPQHTGKIANLAQGIARQQHHAALPVEAPITMGVPWAIVPSVAVQIVAGGPAGVRPEREVEGIVQFPVGQRRHKGRNRDAGGVKVEVLKREDVGIRLHDDVNRGSDGVLHPHDIARDQTRAAADSEV